MEAYICDGVRTPIGKFGGALSGIRPDDLAAIPIRALLDRNPSVDWGALDEVILGDANQAGEDNRNVARMAALLAGLPVEVPGITVNRLCASGLDAVAMAARGIGVGDYDLVIAGGVESMSRAPFVLPKAERAYSRKAEIHDTTLGWRFVNPRIQADHGIDSMAQTADNVAAEFGILRADQDVFAAISQIRWNTARNKGVFAEEIVPVSVLQRDGGERVIDTDEHPRPETDAIRLARLRGVNGPEKSVTAGNSSGINDGAAALLVASGSVVTKYGLKPLARIVCTVSAGVPPRIMGIGPVPATRKALSRAGLSIDDMDVIELNEAFAAQALACLRELGLAIDAGHVNPNGGAIAMGHPLGMSGTRMVLAAARQLVRQDGRFALCTMCVGVGQGVAMILERA